jgi:hypothetical protein
MRTMINTPVTLCSMKNISKKILEIKKVTAMRRCTWVKADSAEDGANQDYHLFEECDTDDEGYE